jgi:hypothetical protein
MKKSERYLLIATVLVCAIAAWLLYGGGGESETTAVVGSGNLAAVRKTFKDNAEMLREGAKIRRDFDKIGGRSKGAPGQGQREMFSDEFYSLLRQKGFPTPNVESPQYKKIQDIDDYCTIDIKANVSSFLARLVDLLQEMQNRGMLIKSFVLDRRSSRNPNEVTLTVTVARVIKQDDESRARLKGGRYTNN